MSNRPVSKDSERRNSFMLSEWKGSLGGIFTGTVLGIAGTFFVFQGRIASLEAQAQAHVNADDKPRSRAIEPAGAAPSTTVDSRESKFCGDVSILSPQDGFTVTPKVAVDVVGTFKNDFPIDSLVLIDKADNNFWPQDPIQVDKLNHRFTGKSYVGASGSIIAAVVRKEQRVLIDYYFKVGHETGKFPSIERLSDAVTECAQVSVIVPGKH